MPFEMPISWVFTFLCYAFLLFSCITIIRLQCPTRIIVIEVAHNPPFHEEVTEVVPAALQQ